MKLSIERKIGIQMGIRQALALLNSMDLDTQNEEYSSALHSLMRVEGTIYDIKTAFGVDDPTQVQSPTSSAIQDEYEAV